MGREALPAAAPEAAVQPDAHDLGAPLAEVMFACVDLETTGGSPPGSRITEIGVVKYRGGERVGSFSTLVDPGLPISRFITTLTGIDDVLVRGAPAVESVLPSLIEFLRGTVFVAHNAPFDFRFLNHDLGRLGYDLIPGPPVCTTKLARRVLGEDVPNVRLATLADHFRTATRPQHRAFEDAEACACVLHALLDLGGRLGILTLGDLTESSGIWSLVPQHSRLPSTEEVGESTVWLRRSRAAIQAAAAVAPSALYTRSHPVFS
jgi:DNA polymerase-3 subunit epsilon